MQMTINDLIAEATMFPYSKEYFEVCQLEAEYNLRKQYCESIEFLYSEECEAIFESGVQVDDDYFMNFNEDDYYREASAVKITEGGLFKKIGQFMKKCWNAVSRFFIKIMDRLAKVNSEIDISRVGNDWMNYRWEQKDINHVMQTAGVKLDDYVSLEVKTSEKFAGLKFDPDVDKETRVAFTNFVKLGLLNGEIKLSTIRAGKRKEALRNAANDTKESLRNAANDTKDFLSTSDGRKKAGMAAAGLAVAGLGISAFAHVTKGTAHAIQVFDIGEANRILNEAMASESQAWTDYSNYLIKNDSKAASGKGVTGGKKHDEFMKLMNECSAEIDKMVAALENVKKANERASDAKKFQDKGAREADLSRFDVDRELASQNSRDRYLDLDKAKKDLEAARELSKDKKSTKADRKDMSHKIKNVYEPMVQKTSEASQKASAYEKEVNDKYNNRVAYLNDVAKNKSRYEKEADKAKKDYIAMSKSFQEFMRKFNMTYRATLEDNATATQRALAAKRGARKGLINFFKSL